MDGTETEIVLKHALDDTRPFKLSFVLPLTDNPMGHVLVDFDGILPKERPTNIVVTARTH